MLCAGIGCGLHSAAAAAAPTREPANVLFLLADDMRFDTIRSLGNRDIQTPNLDRLVRGGFAFTHAFCMGSMVPAVCVPSRAMLMTGRTLFRATASPTDGIIPPQLATWPETMKQAGFATLGVGKWHNDRASFARLFTGGGPVFFGGMSDQVRIPVHDFDPGGVYARTNERIAGVFSSELFADAAITFLRQPGERPFFLHVAFTAPHDPRMAPKAFADRYSPAKIPLPKSFLPEHPFDNGEMKVRDEQLLPWPRTADAVRREIAAYYAMITHLDAQIGRILDALEASGRAGSTLVIFAGDNGLALGRHGLLGKQNLYEHSVRVPLIFSGPGIPKGRRSDALCYLFDLFPTVMDWASLPRPDSVEGRSLWPILTGRQAAVRDVVMGAYRDVQRMVRTDRWKLIWYPQIQKYQLFDLQADPDELHDVSSRSANKSMLATLKMKLVESMRKMGDPLALGTP